MAKVVESCDFRADVLGLFWERSGPARGEWEEEHERKQAEEHEREQAGMEYK